MKAIFSYSTSFRISKVVKKQVLYILIIFLIAAFVNPFAVAAGTVSNEGIAIVSNLQTGRQATIPIQEQNYMLSGGQVLTTFEVRVPANTLALLSSSLQDTDLNGDVVVTIWQYYYQRYDAGGHRWIDATRYETRWQKYDSSISMSSAYLLAGCVGEEGWPGLPVCWPEQSDNMSIGNPGNGQYYVNSVRWAGTYVDVTAEAQGYQAGTSHVKLTRGGSVWYLDICIYKGTCGVGG